MQADLGFELSAYAIRAYFLCCATDTVFIFHVVLNKAIEIKWLTS